MQTELRRMGAVHFDSDLGHGPADDFADLSNAFIFNGSDLVEDVAGVFAELVNFLV